MIKYNFIFCFFICIENKINNKRKEYDFFLLLLKLKKIIYDKFIRFVYNNFKLLNLYFYCNI